MRSFVLGSIIAVAVVTGPGLVASEQLPAPAIPEHGLGLLLETPDAPVGDVYGERPVLT